MESYQEEINQYINIVERYKNLDDTQYMLAYQLKKDALILADRFSEMFYTVRKHNKIPGMKDIERKDRIEHIWKLLREIHVDCRMIWARGKEERLG